VSDSPKTYDALALGATPPAVERIETRLERMLEAVNRNRAAFPLSLSVGVCCHDSTRHGSLQELVEEADRKMYEAKLRRRGRRSSTPTSAAADAPDKK
jgi:GGDEF domain-containing protein